jgi:4-hydroxy-3-polyprenylbenzoate decarboxylase
LAMRSPAERHRGVRFPLLAILLGKVFMRVVVGMSGGSGQVYGIRILESLKALGHETHLIMTNAARETIRVETDINPEKVEELASVSYRIKDFLAPIASGSFRFDAMIIAPCSMKMLAAIANGVSSDLLSRTADVALKERRRLVVVPRETPLSLIHIRNMESLTLAGGVILPPEPAFYTRPKSISDIVDFISSRALDLAGIENEIAPRWNGI